MYNSFCTKVSRKKMAQGVNFFQNFWVQFSYVRKFYFGTGVMWPHWIVLQHAVITDVRRSILHYLPSTPSNSSCPHYGGAPNYHQGPWSHKLQEFSRIQNGLSSCSDLVHLQIKEINFAIFTFFCTGISRLIPFLLVKSGPRRVIEVGRSPGCLRWFDILLHG